MIVARSPGPLLRTADVVAEHVAAELTSDPDIIAGTISADPFFPVLVRAPSGLDFRILTEPEDIRAYYRTRLGAFEILDTTRLVQYRTEWYALHESVATVRHVGDFNGVPGSGASYRVHSVVLFPTLPDGIVGELEWTRWDFADVFRGSIEPSRPADGDDAHLPTRRLEALSRHDELIDYWVSGNGLAAADLFTEDPRWAIRCTDPTSPMPAVVGLHTRTDVVTHVARGDVMQLDLLSRHVDTWYVFAEFAVSWSSGGTSRMASLCPVDADGRFVAQLAYAVECGDGEVDATPARP